jgi:hypothetical protein
MLTLTDEQKSRLREKALDNAVRLSGKLLTVESSLTVEQEPTTINEILQNANRIYQWLIDNESKPVLQTN